MGKFFGDLFDDLKLYARQCAWWNARPKRTVKIGKQEREEVLPTRVAQADAKDERPYFPELPEEALYLLQYLQDLGYVEQGFGGPVRLSYGEIAAWASLCGVALWPWEVAVLRDMSDAFARELVAAEDWQRPAPWAPKAEQIDQKVLERRIKGVLRG